MPGIRRCRALFSTVIVLLVVTTCAVSCGARKESQSQKFCAIFSDSVGLYVGNPVTQMGYKIGTVESITPSDASVEVRFDISEQRPIPPDVRAVIRSTSILADRSLELVGNYTSGPRLLPGQCIPRSHSSTPLSLSRVIGSATNFVNGINPDGSANIEDALRGVDQAVQGNGPELDKLLTMSSSLLDNPDQAVSDLGSIVRNINKMTAMLKESRPPLKEILSGLPEIAPHIVEAVGGFSDLTDSLIELVYVIGEIETNLGDGIQVGLDGFADLLRHLSPHYKGIANMLNPVPRFINTLSYYVNNHQFGLIGWSPPMFRILAPNGLALCGAMNASMPGSCADVNGQPHAVDIALLQYVLMEAHRR